MTEHDEPVVILADDEIDAVTGGSAFLPVDDDGFGRKLPDFIWT